MDLLASSLESEKNVQPRLPPAVPVPPSEEVGQVVSAAKSPPQISSISCLVVQDFGSNVKFQKCL